MTTGHDEFLTPAPGVQSDHPKVIALAKEITAGCDTRTQEARALFEYVRDTVRYSVSVPFEDLADYLALNTLERGWGFCVQKSALLCALARAMGIPARLGFADIRNYLLPEYLDQMLPDKIIYCHCFLEWQLNGRWLKATPSFDRKLTQERGWHLVEFSAEANMLLPATDQEGRPHVEYLHYRGWRLGVPLEEFFQVNMEKCGSEVIDAWRALVRQTYPAPRSQA